jgi:hypothetical protein
VEELVDTIGMLAVEAFGDKLEVWLALLFAKKIEGKFDAHTSVRKRTLKNSGSSIYFINEV